MPKNAALTTLISDGAPFNVTWHLGYPHQGGFKIELLDANDKFMTNLTSGWVDVDTTAQSHPITLPQNLSCKGCTVSIYCCRHPLKDILGVFSNAKGNFQIRLLRQAREWGNKYTFWSCADVNILDPNTDKADIQGTTLCSGNGKYDTVSGSSKCYDLIHQYTWMVT